MTEQTLRQKIEKILWHSDFHDETHQNYPTIKVSWTKDGLEILTNQLLSLIQDYSREREKEVVEDIYKLIKAFNDLDYFHTETGDFKQYIPALKEKIDKLYYKYKDDIAKLSAKKGKNE